MAPELAEENVFTLEEWKQLMQEINRQDRHWTLWSEEEEPLVSSDFDCLPSES
ncbi:MAG: hypothetical protein LDL30_02845 [Desulfovibrio sp.]|nr:hypothetical protein [Desulfovibrio sp.]MCA1985114.1 hypothetical protein [Desulfovibrio sp.]